MGSNYTSPVTPHLGLPLPSPDAPSQREDVARITAALTGVDTHAAAVDSRLSAVDAALAAADDRLAAVDGELAVVAHDVVEQVSTRAAVDLSNVPPAALKAASLAAGVGQPLILTPVVTAPAGEAVGVSRQPVITVTPYRSLYGVSHAASRVQLSTSADFAATVVDVTLGAVSTHTVAAVLAESQRHYVRWRYQDADGVWSDWSGTIGFTTVATSITTPAITSPLNGATGVGKRPTFACSAFAMSSGTDTHTASRWQVSTVSTFATTVIDTGENGTSKTTFTPATDLAGGVQYFVRVQHKGALGKWSAWSPTASFTTLTFSQWMMIWGAGAQRANPEYIIDVASDSAGNIYAIGRNAEFEGKAYPYIISLTNNGTVRWEYNVPSEKNEDYHTWLWRMVFDDSGNLIVAGTWGTPSTYNLSLTKFSPSGTILAQKIYTDVRIVQTYGLKRDSSGNLYVAAWSEDSGSRAFVGKFNAQFDCIWMKSLSDWTTTLSCLDIDKNNNIYICGHSSESALIIKFSSSGNLLSQVKIGRFAPNAFRIYAISISDSGKILVGGQNYEDSISSPMILDISPSLTINNQYHIYNAGYGSAVTSIRHIGKTDNFWVGGVLGSNGGDLFIRYGLSGGVSRVLSHPSKSDSLYCITTDMDGNPIFGGALWENADWPSSYYGHSALGTMAATGGTTGPLPGATAYSWSSTPTDFVPTNRCVFSPENAPFVSVGTATETRNPVPVAYTRSKTLIPY
ncbi:hypothetical protein M2352_004356 [Azospirillum fermentarium]|uniref:hypothetical protein n=1 Tax=Azospirillum fermentarium TaxID=1233114 RepID=UPI002226116F|nr:hypothetical protein [Azospirillum fermentarium]MCW2248696.1 hypothetical protein [Azospirillum fermentarium]